MFRLLGLFQRIFNFTHAHGISPTGNIIQAKIEIHLSCLALTLQMFCFNGRQLNSRNFFPHVLKNLVLTASNVMLNYIAWVSSLRARWSSLTKLHRYGYMYF